MPTDFTDRQLITKSQQGDKRAFDMLVIRYQRRLLGVVGRYCKDSSEVEDIVQEAFIKAYRGLGGFRGESAFYTWLCRIGINVAKNHLLSLSRRPDSIKNDRSKELDAHRSVEIEELASTTESDIYNEELMVLIQNALANMPEELSAALTLREMEGLSYEDISTIMACPIGTVRSRIFRAREILNAKIKTYME